MTEELARVASIGRVCNKQQGLYGNESLVLHGKLWKGVENGRRHKEEEKGEKATKFVERIKKVQKEVEVVLKKV